MPRGTRDHSPGRLHTFRLRGFHPLWPTFPGSSARWEFCNSPAGPWPSPAVSHYPVPATPTGLAQGRFRLFPFRSPLLRESRLLSFPPGTEMFQFPGYRPTLTGGDHLLRWPGFPIRASRDQRLLAPPPGLSQLATPFVASWCLGIHQTPLVA